MLTRRITIAKLSYHLLQLCIILRPLFSLTNYLDGYNSYFEDQQIALKKAEGVERGRIRVHNGKFKPLLLR